MSRAPLQMRLLRSRVRVEIGGYLLADSDRVIELREPGHDAVLYFPPESLRMARLVSSASTSHCQRKGEASYYSIRVGSCYEQDGVWYYPRPIAAAAELAGYFAFRSGAVDAFDSFGTRLIGPARCSDCATSGDEILQSRLALPGASACR